MLLSQKLAGFSKGDADVLRKAMGKKQKSVLDKMKDKFIAGCANNGHPKEICEKIWTDWEAFAQYAFNKSHSTCYSLVAYHTAYLKANYPAEYMAAVLTHSQSNLENVTFFIEECRSMGIHVLGPHVNESGIYFAVNKEGEIRFGLGAIKGAGDAAVEAIIQEREARGPFKDLFDFAERLSQRAVNKKTFECFALSGAFDCFSGIHRRQYVFSKDGDSSLIEKAIKYAAKTQQDAQSAQASLFGGTSAAAMPKPKIEAVEPYSELEKLTLEKDVVGIYISGHPLDNYKFEINCFTNASCSMLADLDKMEGKDVRIAGIVNAIEHRFTKNGKPFGKFTLQDFSGNYQFTLFGQDYLQFKEYMTLNFCLFVEGNIQRNNWGQMNLEFKIRNIELLHDIAQKRLMGVALRVPVQSVSNTFIESLEQVCKKYPGSASLQLYFKDEFEPIQAETVARNYRLKPVNDCFQDLRKLAEVGVITEKMNVRWLTEDTVKQDEPEQGIGTISPTFVLEETES
jgi:DNA polymerase-3 subunit alpha